MANFSISVLFNAIDKLSRPLKKMSKSMRDFAKVSKKVGASLVGVGKKMKDIGKTMSMKLTLPITAFGGLALRSARNFQEAMNMVRAVTDATESDFERLNNQAKELGATTRFSATQAAEAMKFLGMSGLNVQEIFDAMPYVLELAASAQLDMGTAANISTNIMKGYGKEAKDLGKINDVLVNAFTNANVDLQMLGESFKYAGPIAKGAGIDFETTTALIAKMGDAGIQGTMAGTAMRGMLLRLQNPTKKSSDLMKELGVQLQNSGDKAEQEGARGVFDIVHAIKELEEAGATAAEIAEMVGDRAGPALAVLITQGTTSIEEFVEKLKEEGTAARVTEMQMRGLPGVFFNLASAFEAVQLAIVDSGLGDFITKVLTKFTLWLRQIAKANPKLLTFGIVIAGIAAVMGPLLIALGSFVAIIGQAMIVWPTFLAGLVAIKIAMASFAAAIGVSLIAVAPLALALTGLISLGYSLYANWKDLGIFLDDFWKNKIENVKIMIDYIKSLLKILPRWREEEALPKGVKSISTVTNTGIIPKKDLIVARKKIRAAARERIDIARKNLIGGATGGWGESQTDINLKVSTDPGTNVSIEKVAKKKGEAKVKIATDGYVGQNLGAIP